MAGLSVNNTLFKLNQKKASISLQPLDPKTDEPVSTYFRLQYWPEEISDSFAPNWNARQIPGAQLPIYSWVSGGERLIGFQARFSTDIDLTRWNTSNDPLANVDRGLLSQVASQGISNRNLDIRAALIWLRTFQMPEYFTDGTFLPPPKLLLKIPGSRISMGAGLISGNSDTLPCIMKQCDITQTASFPNGNLRSATVQLSFGQIAQRKGKVKFPNRGPLYEIISEGNSDGLGGYPLKGG